VWRTHAKQIKCFFEFEKEERMMSMIKNILAAVTIGLLSTTIGYAENPLPKSTDKLVKYADVGDWTVYTNETSGHCLIVRNDGVSAVQMGVTADDTNVGYLGVFSTLDIGAADGAQSEIFVSIDGNLYSGVATEVSEHLKGGFSGGYILTDDPQFKSDIAKKYDMVVFPETAGAFLVDLEGTFKAMATGRECFKKI
jgi:hypothetical protein